MHNKDFYKCRVCGLLQETLPWGEDGKSPSYNICYCCGVEFGYEDCTLVSIKNYREKWIESGGKWNKKKYQPINWSLAEQLLNIPKQYT